MGPQGNLVFYSDAQSPSVLGVRSDPSEVLPTETKKLVTFFASKHVPIATRHVGVESILWWHFIFDRE